MLRDPAMKPMPPDHARDGRARADGHNAGAWAAAAVLVIAVVLASGAVG
jgi:hypothetical protein